MASSIHPAGKSERHKIRICQRAHKARSQNSPMLITSTFLQPLGSTQATQSFWIRPAGTSEAKVPSTSESRKAERSKAWRMVTENHHWVLEFHPVSEPTQKAFKFAMRGGRSHDAMVSHWPWPKVRLPPRDLCHPFLAPEKKWDTLKILVWIIILSNMSIYWGWMPHFQTTPISIVALIFYPILSHSILHFQKFIAKSLLVGCWKIPHITASTEKFPPQLSEPRLRSSSSPWWRPAQLAPPRGVVGWIFPVWNLHILGLKGEKPMDTPWKYRWRSSGKLFQMSPGSLDQKPKKRWFKRLKKRPRKHVEWAIKIWDCKSGHDQHFPTPSLASSDEDGRNSCVATKETTSVGLLKRESPSHHGCFN